jgi:hypothetical protein
MSEREEFEKWARINLADGGTGRDWIVWSDARAPLLEELAVQEQVRDVMHQDMVKLEFENDRLRAQVEKLETKCALLAASWKKAEDELEKMRAAKPKVSR